MSKEKTLVEKILSKGLIPIVRYGSFVNFDQEDFFEEDDDKDLYGDGIIHFEGCFVCMSGVPLSSTLCGFGFNDSDNDLYVAGIKPDAKILAQPIDDNNEDNQFSWNLWQLTTAKEFYEQVKNHGKKYSTKLAHETLKNQCIVNHNDIEFVEKVDILDFLEEVEDIKYKLIINRDIVVRILKGIYQQTKVDVFSNYDEFEKFILSINDVL